MPPNRVALVDVPRDTDGPLALEVVAVLRPGDVAFQDLAPGDGFPRRGVTLMVNALNADARGRANPVTVPVNPDAGRPSPVDACGEEPVYPAPSGGAQA